MRIDLRKLHCRSRVGGSAHPRGLGSLIASLLAACTGASGGEPVTRAVHVSADFAACGQCATVEVVLLRGEPPACALARSTVPLPSAAAGPQIAAPEEPLTIAAWATCAVPGTPPPPPDPTGLCPAAIQTCANQLPENAPRPDPSRLALLYDGLCAQGSQLPLQQCCAALLPCLRDPSSGCQQDLVTCAELLNVPFTPGQVDLDQVKQLVEAYCQPNASLSAECCAALDDCLHPTNAQPGAPCMACHAMQPLAPDPTELSLQVQRTQSCQRPAELDLPDC